MIMVKKQNVNLWVYFCYFDILFILFVHSVCVRVLIVFLGLLEEEISVRDYCKSKLAQEDVWPKPKRKN